MKRFITLALTSIGILFCWTGHARRDEACDWALLASAEHVATELGFTPKGERTCARYKNCFKDLKRFVNERGLSVLEYAPQRFVGMAYPLGFEKRDRAYVLRGSLRGTTFLANDVRIAGAEKFYYRGVSTARGLEPISIDLGRPLLDRRRLVVEGWTQVKLGMKHQLPLEDVAAFLNGFEPERSSLVPKLGTHGHLEFEGVDERGRTIYVSVVEREDGEVELVTAFRVTSAGRGPRAARVARDEDPLEL